MVQILKCEDLMSNYCISTVALLFPDILCTKRLIKNTIKRLINKFSFSPKLRGWFFLFKLNKDKCGLSFF